MYYDEYDRPKKKKRRRRRSCLGTLLHFVLRLVVTALILAVLAAGVLYLLPTGVFLVEPDYDLSLTDGLPLSPYNLLLLGVDVMDSGHQRSDTMMIASIDREAVRLTSLQRDTLVEIDGRDLSKINAAYAYGGPELAMRTVNQTFETNIVRYVVVDFTALVKVVDALGGIEVDISQAEMEHINKNVLKSAKVFRPLGYTADELTRYGENTHLDGLQALGYARIRKLDTDFVRTSRQRTVVEAMLRKVKDNWYNPAMMSRFVSAALESVQTNLTPVELISLGSKALLAGDFETLRLPVDGTFADNGSSLRMTDREANVQALREFVYE